MASDERPRSNQRSSDQLAVEQYFQSSTYHRTVHQVDPYAADPKQSTELPPEHLLAGAGPVNATRMFDWPHTPMQSRIGGWLGQGVLLWIFAAMIPISIEIIESFSILSSSGYVATSLITQTVGLPVLTSFAFFVVFAMLWHRSILMRFAIASIGSLIALACFCSLIVVTGEGNQGISRILDDIFPVLFVHFLASTLVGLGVQLFTPWTLIEKGTDRRAVAPTGMRWMIELTAVSALCCPVLVNLDLNENLAGIFILGGMSVGGSFIALSVIRTKLSLRKLAPWTKVVSLALSLAYTLFFNGMMAIEQYKNSIKIQDALMILVISIYGAVIVMAVSFVHIRVAKACGWTLIARGKEAC